MKHVKRKVKYSLILIYFYYFRSINTIDVKKKKKRYNFKGNVNCRDKGPKTIYWALAEDVD